MKQMTKIKRIMAAAIATALVVTGLPEMNLSVAAAGQPMPGSVVTISDPETLTDPITIYGNSTLNAGKITVGKSVSDTTVNLENNISVTPEDNSFLVTLSQTAQVMGLSTEISVPIDAVFVLDTSGSMDDDDRAEAMVTAANSAIATLMAANENNRVAVVAFSSSDSGFESYGGGTSNGDAANLLSPLSHYTGDAATAHLQWVNSQGSAVSNQYGSGGNYIAGRTTSGARGGYRHGKNGGTNIQAGIALGAQQLTAVTDTTVTLDGKVLTRLSFIVILSDGAPTFSANSSDWYNPSINKAGWDSNRNYVETQQGNGSTPYEGNGFLAALTAAYYKGKITEHYFGEAASENNRCSIYTIGVGIDSLEDKYSYNEKNYADDIDLAQITLDPATYTTGTYAAANAASYYNYGNTANNGQNDRNANYGWKNYWNKYNAGESFSIRVGSNSTFTITSDSIAASKKYVNFSGLAYNDDHFSSDNASGLNEAVTKVVSAIQMKVMSQPTMVMESPDFEGYVHFYDIIGEYMEVKM